jgi:hypothetical protein
MSGKDLVVAFLTALEQRDLPKASSFLAPGVIMTFPGNTKFKSLEEVVAWSKGRYKFLRKTFQHFDETTRSNVTTVYCQGVLNGEGLDGKPIANVRFLDRFDIMGGKIVDQEVWNDLAEFKA